MKWVNPLGSEGYMCVQVNHSMRYVDILNLVLDATHELFHVRSRSTNVLDMFVVVQSLPSRIK